MIDRADDYIDFLNEAVTLFHAWPTSASFGAAGFKWVNHAAAGACVLAETRLLIESADGHPLIAIMVGEVCRCSWRLRNRRVATDSPDLRLKPKPTSEKSGVVRLHTQFHGGLIYRSWLDRPLDLGGCVYNIVRDENGEPTYSPDQRSQVEGEASCFLGKLVAVIPDVAIHLDREKNTKGELDPEKWLNAVLGTGSRKSEALRAQAQRSWSVMTF